MNVLVFILYIVAAIMASALVPAIIVITREILRRRNAKRALQKLAMVRKVIAQLKGESSQCVARTLSRQFDKSTVEAALEEALNEEAQWADICEKLGLRESWERMLRQSRAWNERAHAARMLGKLRSRSSSKTLVAALVDPHEDTTVRLAAGQAIGSIMDEAVIPHLCEALAAYEERSAPTIAEALVSYGETAVAPVLELLAHSRPIARTWAARVLGRIGDIRATLPLVSALGDIDATTRGAIAEALGRIGDIRGVRALCALALNDPVAPVRAAAAFAVANTGDKDAVRSIVFALRDSDAEVRCRAAEAIALLAPNDWSPLERALFDSCDRVRKSAALSLDRLGAVASWTRALGSPLPEARNAARIGLLAIARAGLSDAITAAALHEVSAVREQVSDLLVEVNGRAPEFSIWIAAAQNSARRTARLQALREIARASTPEAAAVLAEAVISDPSPEARVFAAQSLAHCAERWLSLPALARALMDPVPEVAREAARALSNAYGQEKLERRTSDIPPDSNGSLRRTTDRLRRQATLD